MGSWVISVVPRTCKGVIHGVHHLITKKEFEEASAFNQGNVIKIVNAARIESRPGGPYKSTSSVIVTFEAAELPDSVTILNSIQRVTKYIPEPTQCYKCRRPGHIAK
ncbi:hypothetical protein DAPPUDRAFT_65974 [Daphnia pulex]|uniref:Uncharacterized protein n=1 Tax=Daphnia pulex TaxID=6669 RepID=E9HU58_DAPPU|nr:hypothetical protein DAPPUDRAFT_65974 [Daphnia pulex]|eukprot:EFX64725.1 hypothetical protein DAPPUDRAFT_65974 [Daphnia pulex]